ncbi:TPA: hypothetical protein ACX131_002759 [Citrobacter freundii]
MTDAKAYRPDGGDISEGRLREIADNPYGDEEKSWLAKTVLSRASLTPVGYVDACNLRRMQRGELVDALHTALPFVEDHEGSAVYKPGAVQAALKKIRKVIINNSNKTKADSQ